MANNYFYLLLLISLLLLSSTVSSEQIGTASFTTSPYRKQACTGRKPTTKWFAGWSTDQYGNGGACGQIYRVRCTDHRQPSPCLQSNVEVAVTITDTCSPESNEACPTFVMSEEAFASIAKTDVGVVAISYVPVD